MPQHLGEWHFA